MSRRPLAASQPGDPLEFLVRPTRRLEDVTQLDDGAERNLAQALDVLVDVAKDALALLHVQPKSLKHGAVMHHSRDVGKKLSQVAEVQVKVVRAADKGFQMRPQLRPHGTVEIEVRDEHHSALKLEAARQLVVVLVLEFLSEYHDTVLFFVVSSAALRMLSEVSSPNTLSQSSRSRTLPFSLCS